MEEETQTKSIEGLEGIELTKLAQRGTYGWKIRISGLDVNKLEQKNKEMLEIFAIKKD